MEHDVEIDYTNWKGERRWRRIRPVAVNALRYENSEWHPEMQWILHAIDLDIGDKRRFAMKDIHEWKPKSPT